MISASASFGANELFNNTRFRAKFNRTFNGIGARVADDMQESVSEVFAPPSGVVYPIEWKSERQRKAFFATDGFGAGIPTRRTGTVNRGWIFQWQAQQNDARGDFVLYNFVPYARFVYGGFTRETMNQQPFHRNTGWITGVAGATFIMQETRERIREEFEQSLSGFGDLLEDVN